MAAAVQSVHSFFSSIQKILITLNARLYLLLWLTLFGMIMGSFVDSLIWRWMHGKSLKGRSCCASCGHTLGVWDLFPVFSYLFLKGKCRYCKEKIPLECLLAEAFGAGAFACMAVYGMSGGIHLKFWMELIFVALLLAISIADYEKRIIPNRLLLLAVLNRIVWAFIRGEDVMSFLGSAGISALIPLTLFLIVMLMDRILKRETMGGGDIKLLFVMSLYLTWHQLLLGLYTACLLGLFVALIVRKKTGAAIPFGPFLAMGYVFAVCFGIRMIVWCMGFGLE